jgi:hypothetical protein
MLFDTSGFRDSDAGLIHLISLHCRLARIESSDEGSSEADRFGIEADLGPTEADNSR